MSVKPSELPIPPPASHDSHAVELARIWAAGGKQHVSLRTGLWGDPAAWGILLVDFAKHVAHSYAETTPQSADEALRRLKEGFDAEWLVATDRPIGRVQTES